MKFLKALSLLACLFVANLGFSQNSPSAFSGNAYISNSVANVKSMLVKAGCKEALSEGQILKLEKVFAAKEPKWNKIISSGLEKGDMAIEMGKLDAEYQDQIEKILSTEQKQAFRKMSSNKLKM